MMISVIKRHELTRKMPKLLLLNLAMVTLLAGLTVHEHVDNGDGLLFSKDLLIVVQIFVFLGAVGIMELPEARRRCREWELTFPVKSDFWWRSHFFSLILAGISMMLVYAIIPLGFVWLRAVHDLQPVNIAQLVWDLWVLPTLAFLIVVNLFVLWKPNSLQLGWEKGQHWKFFVFVILMVLMVALCSWFGLTLVFLAPMALLFFLNSRRRISVNLKQSDEWACEIEESVWVSANTQRTSRLLVHFIILRLLFKWPANWIAIIPIALFFGLMLGGFNPLTSDPYSMRFANVFLSIYILTSASGHFSKRQYLVDPLPIDRRTILAWLVVPIVMAMGFGYGGGRLIIQNSLSSESAFLFVTNEDEQAFSVPPRCFKFSPSQEGLGITAPWGETHTAHSIPWLESLSWRFYNPYSIPKGASERFAAWQIQRIVTDVYGEDISADIISERYLSTDSTGLVRVRKAGMNIEEDFDLQNAVSSGPIFPLVFGTVVTAFLLILAINFRALRWMVSIKRQQVLFWSIMMLLLLGHFGAVFLLTTLTEGWILQGYILGTMQRWSQVQTGAVPIAYGLALLAIGLAWSLALHQFRQVESPQAGCK